MYSLILVITVVTNPLSGMPSGVTALEVEGLSSYEKCKQTGIKIINDVESKFTKYKATCIKKGK